MEGVLEHLAARDVRSLRLTAKAFSAHPAILSWCKSGKLPADSQMSWSQACFRFLQQLPKLQNVWLVAPRSLFGCQHLSQVHMLDIRGFSWPLDLYPLAHLPGLRALSLIDCQAEQLSNLSELTGLTWLRCDQLSLQVGVSCLTNLQALRIFSSKFEEDRLNAAAYSSLTALTALRDNPRSDSFWPQMPSLRDLVVDSCPENLDCLQQLVWLHSLDLCTGNIDSGLDSIAPLRSLRNLQRLNLEGLMLAIPQLPALTMLSLQPSVADEAFPDLAGCPRLKELRLWLESVDFSIPALIGVPELSCIRWVSSGPTMLVDVHNIGGRFSFRNDLGYLDINPEY